MKISVITITYNCVSTIERTLKSVIGQTDVNLEYVIVDGASTDGTKEILDTYTKYFSVYISEPDTGISNAYNKALLYATGDIINFMNGDDYFISENVLSHVAKEFEENPGTDILVGKDELNIVSSIHDTDKYSSVYIDAIFPHQAIFAKKEVFEEIGKFDESYSFVGDKDWLLRAWSNGLKFQLKDEIYVHFSPGGRCFGTENVFEEYELARKFLKLTGQEGLLWVAKNRCLESFCESRVYSFLTSIGERNEKEKFFREFFNHEESYWVWGRGSYGSLIIQSLCAAGHSIAGIIDNSIDNNTTFNGIPVFRYEFGCAKGKIIVATPKYDKEICALLFSDGVPTNEVISFHKLEKAILRHISLYEDIYIRFFNKTGLDLKNYVASI